MPGIYIHIPFCRQACYYCDFHFSTSFKTKNNFLEALKAEIYLQKNYLGDSKINTIYFGGGTPSVLSAEEINDIYAELSKYFIISDEAEVTLEANPDDLTKQKLSELSLTPINRLSIGIQSFSDKDLLFLNRVHNAKQAIASVKNAQQSGFNNITVDLIYGIQTLSNDQWKKNIEQVLALEVPHVSCYSLTVEPKTVLDTFIKKRKIPAISQEKSSEHFEILINEMFQNKFLHYEISNFCKEGFYSKHNSNYWKGEKYLGLGPSAHSYDGHSRQWNVGNNSLYIKSIKEKKVPFEIETLSTTQKFNEFILTALRTMWGVDLLYVKEKFTNEFYLHLITEAKFYLNNEMLFQKGNKLFLTDKGKLFADKIASDLFVLEEEMKTMPART